MSFRQGQPKPPNSGRRKGTPNRRTTDVAARLEALGCDPIEGMARIAIDPANDIELRARMYTELAHYGAPKRKAVEMTGDNGGPLLVTSISIGASAHHSERPPHHGEQ